MTAQIAHLNTGDILADIERTYGESGFFIERDFQYAILSRKAADVQRVCPSEGLVLRACLDSTLGDSEALERDYQALLETPHDDVDLSNVSVAFSTLGHFSKAQAIMRRITTAQSGTLSGYRDRALSIGLVQHIDEQYQSAEKMNLEMADPDRASTSVAAARILREACISDEEVAAQLDAAGTVLRRYKRLCRATALISLQAPDELEVVILQVLVDAAPGELFDLNVDLAEQVIEEELTVHSNLVVSFGQIGGPNTP